MGTSTNPSSPDSGNSVYFSSPRIVAFGIDINPRTVAFGIALAVLTLLVYLPVCFHDWIFFDDPAYVADNGVVRQGITWAGIKWAFAGAHASNWHPLTWLSHMLDCQLFGLNPGAQHLVNVLFHAANTALLFALLYRMTQQRWPSAVVAALFAWHPLHVESVAWIAERKDVLSTFFGFLALLAYVRYVEESKVHPSRDGGTRPRSPKSKVWLCYALVFFSLGLMAKPMLVTLPFVMLLLDVWPLRRFTFKASSAPNPEQVIPQHGTRNTRPLTLVLEKAPFFLVSAASCIITFIAQHQEAVVSLKELPIGLRLENALISYAHYFCQTFWPARLAVYYPLPEKIPVMEVFLATALLLAISSLAWKWRKRSPCVLIGWLWFLGALVPVIGLVQVGNQAMADRYMYLPSVGLFIAVVFGIAVVQRGFLAVASPVIAPLALLSCIALTEHQLSYWQNTKTLFEHTLAVTAKNGPAHMMLGVWFEHSGQPDEALQEYQRALECDDFLTVQVAGGEKRRLATHVQLLEGQSEERNGRKEEAVKHYQAALRLDPILVEAWNNLGNLLDELGKPEEALSSYQSAEQLAPQSPGVHENLGSQLLKLRRFDDAKQEYEKAAQLAPADPRPFYLMAKAWLRQGQSARAVAEFENALNRDGNDVQSLVFLARVLAADEDPRVRNGTKAVDLAQKANALTEGKETFVLGSLAMANAEAGHFDDAQQNAKQALTLAGTNTQVIANLQAQLRLYESNQPYREKPGELSK